MCKTSEEFGINNGLGWLDLKVTKIKSNKLRLPHVGWNIVKLNQDTIFLKKLKMKKCFILIIVMQLKIWNPLRFQI